MTRPVIEYREVTRTFAAAPGFGRCNVALDRFSLAIDPGEVLEGILAAIHGEGGAVVHASHLMHDLERVADRVVYLDEGQIRMEGSVDELKARVQRITAVFGDEVPGFPRFPDALGTAREATCV